eukprot:3164850-Rhodomonas_salina.1
MRVGFLVYAVGFWETSTAARTTFCKEGKKHGTEDERDGYTQDETAINASSRVRSEKRSWNLTGKTTKQAYIEYSTGCLRLGTPERLIKPEAQLLNLLGQDALKLSRRNVDATSSKSACEDSSAVSRSSTSG